MKKILFTFLFSVTVLMADASEEIIVPIQEITITGNARDPFGVVTLRVKTTHDKGKIIIKGMSLRVENIWKEVPEKAFANLGEILPASFQLRTEMGFDGEKALYIYFELPPKGKISEPRQIHIPYRDEKFTGRSITTPTDSGSDFESIEL